MRKTNRLKWAAALGLGLGLALLAPVAWASCGSAFCSLSSDWNLQGVWTEPGLRADFRYESITQDQPMLGNRAVAVGEIPMHHDEVKTVNQNLLATLDYALNEAWALSLGIPYIDRYHEHIHNHQGAKLLETWRFTELGDVRALARYQVQLHDPAAPGPESALGVQFGLKLPTGRTDAKNGEGDAAERTLQPGTGTTDLLFGSFFRRRVGLTSILFVQGMWQNALDSKDDFQPGARVNLDVGFRSNVTSDAALLVQVNTLLKGKDAGAQAEPDDSGGTFVFLSPGASYALTADWQAYAFYQLPVYEFVNGLQLTAKDSYALGLSARF
jgi:hypothetical protein